MCTRKLYSLMFSNIKCHVDDENLNVTGSYACCKGVKYIDMQAKWQTWCELKCPQFSRTTLWQKEQ